MRTTRGKQCIEKRLEEPVLPSWKLGQVVWKRKQVVVHLRSVGIYRRPDAPAAVGGELSTVTGSKHNEGIVTHYKRCQPPRVSGEKIGRM